jgi:hypothetical protein
LPARIDRGDHFLRKPPDDVPRHALVFDEDRSDDNLAGAGGERRFGLLDRANTAADLDGHVDCTANRLYRGLILARSQRAVEIHDV